jgi:hypothetical protein
MKRIKPYIQLPMLGRYVDSNTRKTMIPRKVMYKGVPQDLANPTVPLA